MMPIVHVVMERGVTGRMRGENRNLQLYTSDMKALVALATLSVAMLLASANLQALRF